MFMRPWGKANFALAHATAHPQGDHDSPRRMPEPSALHLNPAPTPVRILVVEDDPDIAALLALHLGELATRLDVVSDGLQAFARAQEQPWDAILLDVRLPGMNGLDLCRELRRLGNRTPILMLTSLHTELDRVLGLELGADDYMVKPFGVMELKARVRALLRRSHAGAQAAVPSQADSAQEIRQGLLHMDRDKRRCWLAGKALSLTPREFDLLWHFARQPGRAFSRSDLLSQVWGYGHEGYEHTVNSHINRLRSKLGDAYIQTVWGIGYRFEVPT